MKRNRTDFQRLIILAISILTLGVGVLIAQPPLPSGDGVPVPPPPGQNPPPPVQTPPPVQPFVPGSPLPQAQTPPPPSGWGAPGCLSIPPSADWMNQGTLNVMATGYDNESVLVQIPLVVSYVYNGANYNVTVLNSWNPYSQTWNVGVDTPAYQTDYYFNGFNYNYYAVLPTGTYYFNL